MSPSLTPALSAGLPATTPGWVAPAGVLAAVDQGALGDRQLELLLELEVDRLVADADPRPGQGLAGDRLLHDRLGDVDRDREADPLGIRWPRPC